MRLSINNMKRRADLLEKVIKEKTDSLKGAPGGKVRFSGSKIKSVYFIDGKKTSQGEYIKQDDDRNSQIRGIVQKDYDEKVLGWAEDELRTLRTLIKKYERGTCEDIYGRLSERYRRNGQNLLSIKVLVYL